jgi:hypothetical protein
MFKETKYEKMYERVIKIKINVQRCRENYKNMKCYKNSAYSFEN